MAWRAMSVGTTGQGGVGCGCQRLIASLFMGGRIGPLSCCVVYRVGDGCAGSVVGSGIIGHSCMGSTRSNGRMERSGPSWVGANAAPKDGW